MITLVSVDRIDAVWPHVRVALHGACLRNCSDITTADLWQGCRRGDCFLIVAHDEAVFRGASVWRPEVWPSGPKLRCMAWAGEGMKDWATEMHELACKLAIDCGASSLVTEGREGWGRVFPKARKLRVLYEEPI